jgi:hypothetical protein
VSIFAALAMRIAKRERDAHFIGLWAPTLLLLGVYNKIVKVLGSDRAERE